MLTLSSAEARVEPHFLHYFVWIFVFFSRLTYPSLFPGALPSSALSLALLLPNYPFKSLHANHIQYLDCIFFLSATLLLKLIQSGCPSDKWEVRVAGSILLVKQEQ